MTNILFISEHFNVAGTETFMLNVVKASDATKFHYDFLIFRSSVNRYREEAERLGCHFYTLPPRFKSPIKYLKNLNAFFRTHAKDYDAVHWCGGSISLIAPLIFAKKYKINCIIVHSHNSSCSSFHTYFLHSVFRHLLPMLCNHFFACSTLSSKFFFMKKKNVIIIKNGIDLKKYRFNDEVRKQFRAQLGIEENTFVLGHVGRFEEVKNHSFIIDIFDRLLKNKKNSILILVGTGSLETSIKGKIKEMGIENKVRFMGERNDIDKFMQVFDCFVMPSLYEGLPFVLVEAQAASLPCLISDTINDDAVVCPFTKKMSLSDNAESWAKEIVMISGNSIRKDSSIYLINNGFSIDDTVDYLQSIYSNYK